MVRQTNTTRDNPEADRAMPSVTFPVPGSDSVELSAAQHEALNAAQWLARMSMSYASQPRVDEAPYVLSWSPSSGVISSPNIAENLQLQLRLPEMAMEFTENGQPVPHRIYFEGKSPAEVEAWLLVEMLHRGLAREDFTKALPYVVPDVMTGDAIKHSTEEIQTELQVLTQWLVAASAVLIALRELLRKRYPTEGEAKAEKEDPALLFWPTNFQIGFFFDPDWDGRGPTKVTFSLGSHESPEPRFLVSKPGDSTFILPITRLATDEQIVKKLLAAI
jgi:hypothetical protein